MTKQEAFTIILQALSTYVGNEKQIDLVREAKNLIGRELFAPKNPVDLMAQIGQDTSSAITNPHSNQQPVVVVEDIDEQLATK